MEIEIVLDSILLKIKSDKNIDNSVLNGYTCIVLNRQMFYLTQLIQSKKVSKYYQTDLYTI